ncbi:hypothetical protein L6452_23619 [Arctium lappa]|uniref:Uncharacterized protein n=1 Tax=Arctium lappa TaxID=4217 RepID=A0ACB9B2B4_ARCLA|nr:hypothetical protein L6452_23619 [Arctium lappa]
MFLDKGSFLLKTKNVSPQNLSKIKRNSSTQISPARSQHSNLSHRHASKQINGFFIISVSPFSDSSI